MPLNPAHSLLTYVGLKIIATIIRLLSPLVNHVPKPKNLDGTFTIEARGMNHKITANVYNSKETPPTSNKPHPVLLNWHGSGFMVNMFGQDDYFCRLIADSTEYTVLDCTYRLAPENPFPCGLEDVEDAIAYVFSHSELYDQNRIALSGFSAGAGLLLAACGQQSAISGEGQYEKTIGQRVAKIVGVYPPADLSKKPGGKRAPEGGPGTLPPWLAKAFNNSYLPLGVDRQDPRVSPQFIDVEKLPENILFITCGKDNLAWEAEKMIAKIQDTRKDSAVGHVSCRRFDGVDHGWDKICKKGSEDERKRDEAYGRIIDFLKQAP